MKRPSWLAGMREDLGRTVDLLHEVLDVALEGLVGAREQSEAVLLDLLEVLGRVDAALVQDAARARGGGGGGREGQRGALRAAGAGSPEPQGPNMMTREGQTHELTEYSKNSVTILVEPLRLSVWPCLRLVAMSAGG